MTACYYNDTDRHAVMKLAARMIDGQIPSGLIDPRSIADITAEDLAGRRQVHLFAGLGGWSDALRLAGWPDDRPVWTGSCPCQPFSSAGQRRGVSDERHLWPQMRRLIDECRPPVVFGEQVAGVDGLQWLAGVRADLEAMGYAVGAADMCAACVGAPHRRQRLFWVADAEHERARAGAAGEQGTARIGRGGLADGGGLGDAKRKGSQGLPRHGDGGDQPGWLDEDARRSVAEAGAWDDWELVLCREPTRDGGTREVVRRVEPGTFPLADGIPARSHTLRLLGNAIVPAVAAAFVRAWMEGATT